MAARYFLKADFQPDWVEVSRADWIKAERYAGFRPKLSSDDPRYMQVCATGGFYSSSGISGKVEGHDD